MELKEVFNIDIYEYPFESYKGYSIIRKDNMECFGLKIEKLDLCNDTIREFINRKSLLTQSDNVGDDKISCFYTETEIESLKKSWKRLTIKNFRYIKKKDCIFIQLING